MVERSLDALSEVDLTGLSPVFSEHPEAPITIRIIAAASFVCLIGLFFLYIADSFTIWVSILFDSILSSTQKKLVSKSTGQRSQRKKGKEFF